MIRDNLIRVISARDMNKKERAIYEKFKTDNLNLKMKKEERKFWMTHDSTEYVDWSKQERPCS